MKHPKKINERDMLVLERSIPELAGGAVKRAYYQALSTSGTVKEAINGKLLETSADGSQRVIRNLPMPMAIALGSKRVRVRSK